MVSSKNSQQTEQSQHGQHQFSCRQCGFAMQYQVGSKVLQCQSCGQTENIADNGEAIEELPLSLALENLRLKPLTASDNTVSCDNCGASSQWDVHTQSDLCPYCQTPIAKLDTEQQRLHIEAIVPFSFEKSQANKQLAKWLGKRWFAPNVLKEMSGHNKQFDGIYVPHWTFDSLTYTDYHGMRGIYYVEYIRQTRIVNGKRQTVEVPVTRTRWFPASGQVRLLFDDILVLASMLIPKTIINQLRPWRLEKAVPYTAEYLAGLKAKYYQLDLGQAFQIAQQRMSTDIELAIRRDIGGDTQRIQSKNTHYQNSTYKLILLPVWYSSFEYKGKNYQTVINGQNGKVAGQYPKSPTKIAAAVIVALILLGTLAYFYYQNTY